MAPAASTVISPSVSKPRKSTRVTLTTLRPWPSGTERAIIASDTVVGGLDRAPTASVITNTMPPTTDATAMRTVRRAAAPRVALEAVGEPPQHEHEQHRRQRLDGDLGEGEVGRALDHEQAGHGVADHAEEQRAGEAPAHDRGGERRAEQERGERDVGGDVDEVGPARPPRPAEQQRARDGGRGEQDDAEVQRAASRAGPRPSTRLARALRPRSDAVYPAAADGIGVPTGEHPVDRPAADEQHGRRRRGPRRTARARR